MLAGLRSLSAENGLPTVDGQHRLGEILTNWTWSHHQFETVPFSICRPNNRVDLIVCGFLRRSKRPANSSLGASPILPIACDQFFKAG